MSPTDRTVEGRGPNRRLRAVLIGVAVLAAVALVAGLVMLFEQPKTARKPTAQQIQLVRPATPPPPPPKPPEKPPEPPKVKEEVKVDTPRPQDAPKPAEAPPPAPLGVDATGSGQGDGFGLAANPGGRDLSAGPQIGGGGGTAVLQRAQFASYRDVIVRHVNDELNRLAELKTTDGQIALQVWIDRAGRIQRVELRDASERQTELIRGALVGGRALREPPPDTMPQPVWVLINLRELG